MMSAFTASTLAVLAQAEFIQKIEEELNSLWTLPWQKVLPDVDFPDAVDNYPDEERSDLVKSFDGKCVGCIAAGWVFCMDGEHNNSNQNSHLQENGSCQPTWNHCTNGGDSNFNFETRTEFTECNYTGGVKNPATDAFYSDSMKIKSVEITPAIASTLLDPETVLPPTLLDVYLHTDAY